MSVLIPHGMNLYNYAFWYVFLIKILELHTLECLSIALLFCFNCIQAFICNHNDCFLSLICGSPIDLSVMTLTLMYYILDKISFV